MRTCRRASPYSFGSADWTRRAPTRSATASWRARAQLGYATREERAIVTANVVDFIRLAREAVATNTGHAGIVLVPSSFRGDEFEVLADAIVDGLKPYPKGLHGVVLYVKRG